MMRIGLAIFGVGCLTACGGGGGGPVFELEDFDAVVARGDQIDAAISASNAVSRELLETGGSATYQGAIFLNVPSLPTVAVVGEIALDVDLEKGTVGGEAGNFFNMIEEPAPGTLKVTNGVISGISVAQFEADLDGEIVFEDENRMIDATLNGAFGGDRGGLIDGGLSGTGTTDSGETATVDGNILLQR